MATGLILSWCRVPTKLGAFHLAAHGGHIVRTALPGTSTKEFLAALSDLGRPEAVGSPREPALVKASRQLSEWAAGSRTSFAVDVDPVGTPFQRRVWNALARIPYGQTRSYAEVAAGIGKPGAARAVGQANNRNPVAPFIPCHRVVASGGKLGGYGGGLLLKQKMLRLEGVLTA